MCDVCVFEALRVMWFYVDDLLWIGCNSVHNVKCDLMIELLSGMLFQQYHRCFYSGFHENCEVDNYYISLELRTDQSIIIQWHV